MFVGVPGLGLLNQAGEFNNICASNSVVQLLAAIIRESPGYLTSSGNSCLELAHRLSTSEPMYGSDKVMFQRRIAAYLRSTEKDRQVDGQRDATEILEQVIEFENVNNLKVTLAYDHGNLEPRCKNCDTITPTNSTTVDRSNWILGRVTIDDHGQTMSVSGILSADQFLRSHVDCSKCGHDVGSARLDTYASQLNDIVMVKMSRIVFKNGTAFRIGQ